MKPSSKPMKKQISISRFLFLGNSLCLDFVNTEIIARGKPEDLLPGLGSLAVWLNAAGLFSEQEIERALSQSTAMEREHFFQSARTFRSQLRRLAARLEIHQSTSSNEFQAINHWLRAGKVSVSLYRDGKAIRLEKGWSLSSIFESLAPIAESAAELTANSEYGVVRKCSNPKCILYFFDTSKNHSRRWCSMSMCGNRFKAASFYRRNK